MSDGKVKIIAAGRLVPDENIKDYERICAMVDEILSTLVRYNVTQLCFEETFVNIRNAKTSIRLANLYGMVYYATRAYSRKTYQNGSWKTIIVKNYRPSNLDKLNVNDFVNYYWNLNIPVSKNDTTDAIGIATAYMFEQGIIS